jgi:hypothetical protein
MGLEISTDNRNPPPRPVTMRLACDRHPNERASFRGPYVDAQRQADASGWRFYVGFNVWLGPCCTKGARDA